jgi:hypothetical protein
MKRTAILLCLVPCLGGAAPLPVADAPARVAEDFEAARKKVRRQLAEGLYATGKWCHKKKWYEERDRLYGEAVEADPDHLKARKALGFERRRDGTWERREVPELERNRGRVDFEAIEERAAGVLEDWCEETHELLVEFSDTATKEQRDAEYELILERFPEDEVAHKALGHVPGWKGRPWVSVEIRASYDRRKELKALVAKERKTGSAMEDLEPRGFEQGLVWEAAGKNARARAFSRIGKEDVRVALEMAYAAQSLINDGCGIDVQLPEGLTFYLVEDNAQLVEVAVAHPESPAEGLETVGSFWLDWRSMVTWGEGTALRADAVARQTVSWLLRHKFKLSPKQGWAWEGLGLYLSFRVSGTRLRFFVRESDYTGGPDRATDLRDPNSNWLRLAKGVLEEQPPKMDFLLGKDVNGLTERDLLVAYALGAYLVEGHREKLPRILTRIVNEPATKVLEEELGKDPEALTKELRKWLTALY